MKGRVIIRQERLHFFSWSFLQIGQTRVWKGCSQCLEVSREPGRDWELWGQDVVGDFTAARILDAVNDKEGATEGKSPCRDQASALLGACRGKFPCSGSVSPSLPRKTSDCILSK